MPKRQRMFTRRSFIKTTTAAGVCLTAGPVYAPAVHAQTKPIKLGYVSPQTGPLAAFAEADNFVLDQFREAMKGGLKIGNATRPIEVSVRDSQSNPNRAAEVAKELIVRDKVDLMLVASTPETTNPVCTQCEIEEVACVSTKAPWQPWFIGQQANPGGGPPAWKSFNYVYHPKNSSWAPSATISEAVLQPSGVVVLRYAGAMRRGGARNCLPLSQALMA